MSKTKIEWATHTVNWLAGCSKVSPACTHCYAESMTARLAAMPNAPARYRGGPAPAPSSDGLPGWPQAPVVSEAGRWTGRVVYDRDALWAAFEGLTVAKKPRRVFVNSMSDTFHGNAPPGARTRGGVSAIGGRIPWRQRWSSDDPRPA